MASACVRNIITAAVAVVIAPPPPVVTVIRTLPAVAVLIIPPPRPLRIPQTRQGTPQTRPARRPRHQRPRVAVKLR